MQPCSNGDSQGGTPSVSEPLWGWALLLLRNFYSIYNTCICIKTALVRRIGLSGA